MTKWDKYLQEQYSMIKVGGLIYHHHAKSWRIITDIFVECDEDGIPQKMITYFNFGYMEYTSWKLTHLKHQLEMQQATMYA
jgi:hypothetical protein